MVFSIREQTPRESAFIDIYRGCAQISIDNPKTLVSKTESSPVQFLAKWIKKVTVTTL